MNRSLNRRATEKLRADSKATLLFALQRRRVTSNGAEMLQTFDVAANQSLNDAQRRLM
jgi:hypothetical protein